MKTPELMLQLANGPASECSSGRAIVTTIADDRAEAGTSNG